MNTIKLPIRSACAAVALVAVAALLAACGSSSSSSSSTTASASTGSGSNTNRTALAACLKKHGITLPSRRPGAGGPPSGAPGSGSGAPPGANGSGAPPGGNRPRGGFFGGGANSSKFRAAFKACGANFPARGRFRAPNRQAIQKYVACVRSHGYKLPNPNFSGKGPIFPSNIRTDKKFQSASKACQSLLAPPRSSSGSSSST